MVIKNIRILNQPDEHLAEKLPKGLSLQTDSPIITLAGPNGSGKSALLRMINSSLENYRDFRERNTVAEFAKQNPTLGYLPVRDVYTADGKIREGIVHPSSSVFEWLGGQWSSLTNSVLSYGQRPDNFDAVKDMLIKTLTAKEMEGSYYKFVGNIKSSLGGHHPDLLDYEQVSRNLWGGGAKVYNSSDVDILCQKLLALKAPNTLSNKWKYCKLDVQDPDATYVARFAPEHPFERRGKTIGNTAGNSQQAYFDFKDAGPLHSSGQGVAKGIDELCTQVGRFFEQKKVPTIMTNDQKATQSMKASRTRDWDAAREEYDLPLEHVDRSKLVVLMDEPTTSLDYRTCKSIGKKINDLAGQYEGRLQFFIATHDPSLIENPTSKCVSFYQSPVTMVQGGQEL